MNNKFLENLNLASLIAPVTTQEFLSRYWEKQPLIIHRKDSNYYGNLFTLNDYDDAITRDPSYVKVADAIAKKNVSYSPLFVQGLEQTLEDFRGGATLVLDQLQNKDPKLGLLCRTLAQEFSHRLQTNLYLTPPHGKGFTPHWDNHDVFILQVEGYKHWNIERERRVVPMEGEKQGDQGRELRGDLHTFTLNRGDIAYIPQGFVHAAECGPEASLHITLGIHSVNWSDLLRALITASMKLNEDIRGMLPFGFMHAPQSDLVRSTAAILRRMSDEEFLNVFMTNFRDECVKGFKMDISGQILEFLRPAPLLITDVVGPRPGIVYQLQSGDDSIEVKFGSRSIVFLGIFQEALGFALKTPSFVIRTLPGNLAEVERIVLIERLIQEGLVVRK
ncbi:MAG TPA: cupin domain-containing protein [Rhizomicrobium sp.]|nr:cupin domain-containing protein [Rhizomicrobium sp.]